MPTGTRSSISANSETKPRMATASVLIPLLHSTGLILVFVHQLRLEDQPVGAHGDQQHGGDVARPGHREERPGRQPQIEGEDVVVIGAAHLVEQRVGLHRHHEQQNQRREYVDDSADIAAPTLAQTRSTVMWPPR